MATTPQVTTSERLWSDEVGLAKAGEPARPVKDEAYVWSNGRRFIDGHGPYEDNNQQPGQGS